jgi:hypothetical protein
MCIKHNFYWTFKKGNEEINLNKIWIGSLVRFLVINENVNYVYLDVIQYPVKTQIKLLKNIIT